MKILTEAQAEKIVVTAVKRLGQYVKSYGLSAFVEGVSGGIDSAVIVAIIEATKCNLAAEGYLVDTHYYFLNCHSKQFDHDRADALARALNIKLECFDLSYVYDSPLVVFAQENAKNQRTALVARGNAACRERMKFLYQAAFLFNGIYVDTDDLSEEWMRFWTLKGDEGNVKVIQHLTKREVYDLGEYLGVPQIILDSAPGDGLNVTETNAATDQLGLPYEATDYIVSRFIQEGFNGEDDERVNGEYRQLTHPLFISLVPIVAQELGVEVVKVKNVLRQVLRYAYKVKFGDSVAHLLPTRSEFGLPDIGTQAFNDLYLPYIRTLNLNL